MASSDPKELLEVSNRAADAVLDALSRHRSSGLTGSREGQYSFDVVADDAASAVLHAAGLAVFSEESGLTGSGALTAVLDPVDGSTNYSRGLPFSACSIAIADGEGVLTALVVDLSLGTRYHALRGGGSFVNGKKLERVHHGQKVLASAGLPVTPGPFAQQRSLGACALECCLVATGALDGYAQIGQGRVHPWDYLAGLLILTEVGGAALELDGLPLFALDARPRRLIVAASPERCEELASWAR
jgi:fructose-1,6-bisphosphatase/inositol monophosphatase family enzyme